MKRFLLLLGVAVFLSAAPLCADEAPGKLSKADVDFFEKKIRPVLVKHCYQCHSAGSKELGGKLLLDSAAGMLEGGESGPVVQVGKPEASLIVQALRYDGFEMPPEQPLPENVINDFVAWVKRGAPDPRRAAKTTTPKKPAAKLLDPEKHWSFFARQPVTAPDVADAQWPRDDIDRFVLARIEAAKLKPTSDAAPDTLIRRLHYDLTGLPPSYKDVQQFKEDMNRDGQMAVARLVDRLLLSPQFGERWGRHWLDVARYGESNGDDGLGRNASFPHAWRYRDYVIDAFNKDTPYDQFLRQQIAGDLLPATTAQQRNRQLVATGFLAIGSKPAVAMNKNFAMDIVDDQINVVSTAVMGLSVACARCHDHKHDPIPTRDYYAMAGIFKSTETLYGRAANEKLTAPPTPLHTLVSQWKDKQPQPTAIKQTPEFPAEYAAEIKRHKPVTYEPFNTTPTALKLNGKAKFNDAAFATVKDTQLSGELAAPAKSYSVAFWFKNDMANNKRPITAYLFSLAPPGAPETGDHLGIGGTHEKDKTGKLFLFNGSKTKAKLAGSSVIQPGTWNHVVLVRNGKQLRLHLNGVTEPEFAGELPATYKDARTFFAATRSDKFAPLQGNMAQLAVFDRALSAAEIEALHTASGQPKGVKPAKPLGLAMGVRERSKPENCKVHINGQTGKYGPLAPRGFLTAHTRTNWADAANGSQIEGQQSGRLQLADWLTHPQHPQTARVMVNRIWRHLFGQAIVATPDDFGVYGARPSHPALLDHLADSFVRQGWSMKTLIRKIVLSRTYQLDSRIDPKLAQADSSNALYTHHRRRRLDAESLRDSLLTASGDIDLSPSEGSPVSKTVALINKPPVEASDLHHASRHRSVYLCMLRNAPPPELAAFDLPTGVSITGARTETTLPSQTLFLLNSPFVIAQSKLLAKRLMQHEDAESRIEVLYQHALQRSPTSEEMQRATQYVKRLASQLQHDNQKTDEQNNSDPQDAAIRTWASVCQAVLASNEFRYVD